MARVVPMLFADVGAPLSRIVWATDARGSEQGDAGAFGIVATRVSEQMVERIYEAGRSLGYTVPVSSKLGGAKYSDRPLRRTVPFTRLPQELFDDSQIQWQEVSKGLWVWEDHITLGEARAVIRRLDLMLLCGETSIKSVSLQDNMAVAGAYAKGRSGAVLLNYLARRRAARTIAGGIRDYLPWVETSKQPADKTSRFTNAFEALRASEA